MTPSDRPLGRAATGTVAPGREGADILVLSSAIGSGHMRASAALGRGIGLTEPARSCRIVDFPREVSPTVERALRAVAAGGLWLSALITAAETVRRRGKQGAEL